MGDFTKRITVLENIMGDTEVRMNKYSETISTLEKEVARIKTGE